MLQQFLQVLAGYNSMHNNRVLLHGYFLHICEQLQKTKTKHNWLQHLFYIIAHCVAAT